MAGIVGTPVKRERVKPGIGLNRGSPLHVVAQGKRLEPPLALAPVYYPVGIAGAVNSPLPRSPEIGKAVSVISKVDPDAVVRNENGVNPAQRVLDEINLNIQRVGIQRVPD